ncbi:hypothetical protein ACFQ08_00085 [Streptosporangium algeriense]|uniref:SinR family protein n=1 Tax=Streptosporangium algeriense TaxID=1682748 RepID=A0ABW3DJ21_9ACTN
MRNVLLVGYDLKKPGQNYAGLITYLKSQSSWWHALDSSWIVITDLSAVRLRDGIKEYIDANDVVLVMDINVSSWASSGLGKEASDWLQQNV